MLADRVLADRVLTPPTRPPSPAPSPAPSAAQASLPRAPGGQKWCRLVDTNLPSPKDFTPGGNAGVDATYGVQGFSSIVLISKPA